MMSEKCKQKLSGPAPCNDIKAKRARVVCGAKDIQEKKNVSFGEAMRESWKTIKNACPKR